MAVSAGRPLWYQACVRAFWNRTLAGVMVCAAGCKPASPQQEERVIEHPDQLVATSAHFELYVFPEDTSVSCGPVLDLFERYLSAVKSTLPESVPPPSLRYFKYLNRPDLVARGECIQSGYGGEGISAGGCQVGTSIYSGEMFHQHELIHGFSAALGRSARFLDEGLAEALSCDGGLRRKRSAYAPLDELIHWEGDPALLQATAPLLVAYLIRLDSDAFSQYFEAGIADEFDAHESALKLFGVELEALYNEALAETRDTGCLRRWECAGEPLEVNDGIIQGRNTCLQVDHFRLEVEETSLVQASLSAVGSCADETVLLPGQGASGPTVAVLSPGEYFVSTLDIPGALIPFESTPLGRAECNAASAPSLRLNWELRLLSNATEEGDLLLHVEEDSKPESIYAECEMGTVWTCDSCDSEDSCVPICDPSAPVPTGDWLRIKHGDEGFVGHLFGQYDRP